MFQSLKEENYKDAWQFLDEKYSKRKNVEEILATLLQQPAIDGSRKSLIDFSRSIKKCLNGLNYWDVDSRNWDILLIHLLTNKLNKEMKIEWNEKNSAEIDRRTIFDFINFLHSKEGKGGEEYHQNRSCCCCNKDHNLWKCKKFKKLNIDERVKFVGNIEKICKRCLSQCHTDLQCWKPFKCTICFKKEHHFLLHDG